MRSAPPPFPTSTPATPAATAHPREVIQTIIGRYWLACGLRALVEVGVANVLFGRRTGMGISELAAACHAHPQSLAWLLRALAPAGLVTAKADGWHLLPAGELLARNHPDSLQSVVWNCGKPAYGQMLRNLPDLVVSTSSAVPAFYPALPAESTLGDALSPSWSPAPTTADAMATTSEAPQARRSILTMLEAFGDLGALLVAAKHRWADQLSDGPLSLITLATRLNASPSAVAVIAHALSRLGIIESVPGERYALTDAGHTLRYDRPDSMRTAVLMCADPVWWEAMWHLVTVVRTGKPCLPYPYQSGYAYLAADPDAQNLFDRFMVHRSAPVADQLGAWATTATVPDGSTIVDVGGGRGTLLAAILARRSSCRGVLLERDVVLPQARTYLIDRNVADRCQLIAGDFFTDLPPGHATYLLGSVVHNWGDLDASRLLGAAYSAMSSTPGPAQLVCVEALLPDESQPIIGHNHLLYGYILRMMSLFPQGHERTVTEYTALLGEAGFEISSTTALPHGLSLIIAVPITEPTP
ncbi:methyltransferase (plasmid) [Streptosporangium sp. NBC_01495]|uniref:methyltransferase n=1 Tax=Streptosporangium sp. NBC_01495 TaxID=2903899 RepID=UPI002E346A3F|nr:methyltransferase [Streptosporangium sp. NBC_01495]